MPEMTGSDLFWLILILGVAALFTVEACVSVWARNRPTRDCDCDEGEDD